MRQIPLELLEHKKQDATTTCKIIRIQAQNGEVIGLTTLDQDIVYDDGAGPITYYAPVGFQPSTIYEALGFEVSNTEMQALVVPEYNLDLDEFSVNAGLYDYSSFVMYEINYEDLTMGHWVVMSGTMGQMRSIDGIQIFGEMRSMVDSYRRNIVELDSLTCRAKFGSTYADERFPCLYNADALWQNGAVTSVGVENQRVFESNISQPNGTFYPGLLQFLTGSNAGKYIEVESYLNLAGKFTLSFPVNYPIATGDTFRVRRDCNKRARDTAKGCKSWFGADWALHFRGEPDIPIADQGAVQMPGAQTPQTFTVPGVGVQIPLTPTGGTA